MIAKITLNGLDRYVRSGACDSVSDLWDLLQLPAGVDRDTFIDSILYRSFEFPLIYMEAETIRQQIGLLSKQYLESMTRTWSALTAEYNPMHNFDRYEESEDNRQTTGSGSSTSNAADKTSGTGQSDQLYQGDTANTFNPASRNESTSGATSSSEGSSTSNSSGTDDNKHNAHIYGNVGVTTSQEMLISEIKLRSKYNFYQLWADAFVAELCVGIY